MIYHQTCYCSSWLVNIVIIKCSVTTETFVIIVIYKAWFCHSHADILTVTVLLHQWAPSYIATAITIAVSFVVDRSNKSSRYDAWLVVGHKFTWLCFLWVAVIAATAQVYRYFNVEVGIFGLVPGEVYDFVVQILVKLLVNCQGGCVVVCQLVHVVVSTTSVVFVLLLLQLIFYFIGLLFFLNKVV